MTLLDSHVALRIRRQTKRESKNSRKTGPFQSKPRLQRRRSSIEIRCHGVERRFLLQHRWQPPRSSLLRLESAARRSVLKASKFMHRCKIWCHSFRTFQRQTFPKLGNPFLESNRRNRRRCCLSNGQSLLSHCSKHFDEQGPCGMGAFWNNLFAPTLGSWNSASDLRRIRKIVRKIQQIESRSVKGKPLRTHDQWHPEYLGKDAEESHLGFFQSIPLLSLCFPKGEIFRAKKKKSILFEVDEGMETMEPKVPLLDGFDLEHLAALVSALKERGMDVCKTQVRDNNFHFRFKRCMRGAEGQRDVFDEHHRSNKRDHHFHVGQEVQRHHFTRKFLRNMMRYAFVHRIKIKDATRISSTF